MENLSPKFTFTAKTSTDDMANLQNNGNDKDANQYKGYTLSNRPVNGSVADSEEDAGHKRSDDLGVHQEAVTYNQFENAVGTKIEKTFALAGDISSATPQHQLPGRYSQFKGVSNLSIARAIVIAGNVSTRSLPAVTDVYSALQKIASTQGIVSDELRSPFIQTNTPESLTPKAAPRTLGAITSACPALTQPIDLNKPKTNDPIIPNITSTGISGNPVSVRLSPPTLDRQSSVSSAVPVGLHRIGSTPPVNVNTLGTNNKNTNGRIHPSKVSLNPDTDLSARLLQLRASQVRNVRGDTTSTSSVLKLKEMKEPDLEKVVPDESSEKLNQNGLQEYEALLATLVYGLMDSLSKAEEKRNEEMASIRRVLDKHRLSIDNLFSIGRRRPNATRDDFAKDSRDVINELTTGGNTSIYHVLFVMGTLHCSIAICLIVIFAFVVVTLGCISYLQT